MEGNGTRVETERDWKAPSRLTPHATTGGTPGSQNLATATAAKCNVASMESLRDLGAAASNATAAAPDSPQPPYETAPAVLRDLGPVAGFCAVMAGVQVGLFFYQHGVPAVAARLTSFRLKHRGPHYDALGWDDWRFIMTNKALTWVMVFHMLRYAVSAHARLLWNLERATFLNTLGALPALFVVYDLFYSLFHRALHHRAVYRYVHKHHHRQIVPTRGLLDSVNVHPFEYLVGEYTHLLALHLVTRLAGAVHALAIPLFLGVGGVLAALNHTRFDVFLRLPLVGLELFDSKAHDTHHAKFTCNYAQYTMVWDKIFGTYVDYEPDFGKAWHDKKPAGSAPPAPAAAAAAAAVAKKSPRASKSPARIKIE